MSLLARLTGIKTKATEAREQGEARLQSVLSDVEEKLRELGDELKKRRENGVGHHIADSRK